MRHALPFLVVALILLAFAAPAARADSITYAFEGTWGFPTSSPSYAMTFSGTFTYDTDWGTRDSGLSGSGESYWRHTSGTSMSWWITFGGTTYSRDPGQAATERVDVVDSLPSGAPVDDFAMGSGNSSGEFFEIWLRDNSATWLDFGTDDPSIPAALSLDDVSGYFDTYIAFRDVSGIWIDGEITSLNPVPEPATLALLGAGLAGLGLHRRRRCRR